MSVALSAEAITKQYPGTVALEGVDFQARAGEVTAVIGGNGAGKSTLMKILAGAEQPTAGRLWRDGREVRFRSVREAEAEGIALLPQELALVDGLTVAENVFLGRERARAGIVDRAVEEALATVHLGKVGLRISPRTRVSALGVGERQLVAVARALAAGARVVIMDEPTAALGGREVELLFTVIRELTAAGVAVVYISHRLDELLRIANRVTVLRDGRKIDEAPIADVSEGWIVARMTDGEGAAPPIGGAAAPPGSPLLEATSRDIDLAVGTGEVVGLYGLVGAGRTALLESMAGLRRPAARVTLGGRALPAGSGERQRAGLHLVPEDRRDGGLLLERAVAENITLGSTRRDVVGFWIDRARESRRVRGAIAEVALRPPRADVAAGLLSGGNQQKVLLARALLANPAVLLLDEPTRGIDVCARAEIWALVRRFAGEGKGVVVSSSDARELMSLCDRILVLARGRVVATFPRGAATEAALVAAAANAKESNDAAA